MLRAFGWSLGLLFLSTLEAAASEKTVYAELVGGNRIAIASVKLPAGGQGAYGFDLDESVLSEHFLSMRPFKCLDLERQTVCHLPYPYELTGEVQAPDWRDLEYRLLFLFKDAGDYGINFENGYYFHLEQDGERLIGTRLETNMDQLASPPADGVRYPLEEAELYESEGASHQLLRLVIE
ncbi:MAG: hypothetical protein ACR2RF_30515 [Geminicoccaceae bacterium]